jgi:hypothetical protein
MCRPGLEPGKDQGRSPNGREPEGRGQDKPLAYLEWNSGNGNDLTDVSKRRDACLEAVVKMAMSVGIRQPAFVQGPSAVLRLPRFGATLLLLFGLMCVLLGTR